MIRNLYDLSLEDAEFIKKIEVKDHGIPYINNGKKTNHDVKSVEYFIKHKLRKTSLADYLEWTHFALTSEDPTNLSYALALSDSLEKVMIPAIENVYNKLEYFSREYAKVPMLSRTHGQPASPTTVGKEFKIHASRIGRQFNQIKDFKILAKLNGSSGNYNAQLAAYPEVKWMQFSEDFIESFNKERRIKLELNLITPQIEPHDNYAELFDTFKRLNNDVLKLDKDIWRYISEKWIIKEDFVKSDVGSSTMPHKWLNPIKFENSEGNVGIANALFGFMSDFLPDYRLQRDLSDSTVERVMGTSFGHSLIAYNNTLKGLNEIKINDNVIIGQLNKHPEVISEGYQTILRKEGYKQPYEKLAKLTKGKKVTLKGLRNFVDELEIPNDVKDSMKRLTPENYIGLADVLAGLKI